MNNGGGQNNPNYSFNELSLFEPNSVVTPDVYANQMQRLQAMRAQIATYEEKLSAGYAKYQDLEQRQMLEDTIRQGQLAAQLLAQMEHGSGAGTAPTPALAGPSNAQRSMFPPQFHGQAATTVTEVPSSARIVEVPSSQGSPQSGPSVASSSRSEAQAPPSRPRVPVAPYNASQGYANPYGQMQDWTAFGASPSVMYGHAQPLGAHAQQSSYQSGQWPTLPASHHRPQGYPSGAHVQAPPLPPTVSRSAQQAHHTGSQQVGTVPQGEHVASGPSYPVGAPSSSSSTQARMDGVNRSNASQSSGPASRPGQPSVQGQTQQRAGVPHYIQEHLFQYFRRYSVLEVQIVMVQAMLALQRKQVGREKTSAEIEAESKIKPSIVRNAEVIADYMKGYPQSEVREVFRICLALVSRQQQAAARPDEGKGSTIEQAPPPHPQKPVPSTSTSIAPSAPPPHSANAQPSVTVQPPASQSIAKPPSLVTPAAAAPASSTAVSVPAPSNTAPSSTSKSNAADSQFTQISWYTPRDPNAPVMVRNAKGQIQWIHRHNLVQPAAPTAPSQPPAPSTPPVSKAAPQPELPTTPQPRPAPETTAWTPEKADRSRLAQDIMRSLGRPKGAFGTPLSPTDTTFAPRFEVIHPPTESPTTIPILTTPAVTAKRKAYPSPARSSPISPTAAKRQRLDGQLEGQERESIVGATVGGLPKIAAIDGIVPGAALEHGHEAEPPVVDWAVTKPLPPPADVVEQEVDEDMHHIERAVDVGVDAGGHDLLPGLTDVDSVRGISVTSSEAANIERTLDVLIAEPELGPEQPLLDGVGIPDMTSSPLHAFSAVASNATPPPSSPVSSLLREKGKGKEREREPLFLPSPSGSPAPPVHDEDEEDMRSDSPAGPRLLGRRKDKGKGRALDTDFDGLDLLVASGDEASEASSFVPRKRRRVNRAYVLAPPLPAYAASLRGNEIVWWGSQSPSSSVASGSRNVSRDGLTGEEEEESADELAEWHVDDEVSPAAESKPDDEEAEAAAELSYTRVRETRCSWDGCGIVLNSMAALQRHIVLHAGENEGSFGCRWKSCLSIRFKDAQSLARHLQKHAKSPLWCAYEGCDHSFTSASELLHHHQSSRHRDGQLRKSYYPAPPPENRRQLSELPEVVPAYMFAVSPIRRHPVSRDRHQWVGPKVLENITSFKYTGRRSHAGHPSRLSRRLAEKVAAVELASMTPESGHAQIQRWIDGEYLDFADGYDASRRHRLWCADIPAGEVTQMVHDGLALFVDDQDADGELGERAGEADRSADAGGGLGGGDGGQERDAGDRGGEDAAGAEEDEGELASPPDGGEGSPARTNAGAQGKGPTIRLKLTLPRRTNVIRLPPRPNRTEAMADGDRDAEAVAGNVLANPDQVDGRKARTPASQRQSPVSARPQPPERAASLPQYLVSVSEPSTDEVVGSVWTVWPPAKEESVETH